MNAKRQERLRTGLTQRSLDPIGIPVTEINGRYHHNRTAWRPTMTGMVKGGVAPSAMDTEIVPGPVVIGIVSG
jgi:hypothetical protein